MDNLAELLALAKSHHGAGRLAEAEPLYRQILSTQADHAETHYLLGTVCNALGRPQEAVARLSEATRLNPHHLEAYHYLGFVFETSQAWDQAVASYQQALRLKPEHAEISQRLQRALAGQALQSGNRLAAQGRLDEAAMAWQRAIELDPGNVDALAQLAADCERKGKFDEAADCYRRYLSLRPNSAAACNNLGIVLSKLGRSDEAAACLRQALGLNPAYAEAYNNLGVLLSKQGKTEEAAAYLRRAVELKPDYAEAFSNLGNALGDRQADEAIAAYRRAVELNPRFGPAHCNLALRLVARGQVEEALSEFQHAVDLSPGDADVFGNYGVSLQATARLDEATAAYRTAVGLNPTAHHWHANLIYALNFHPDYDAETVFAEHREWGRRHADPLSRDAAPHLNDRDPRRRLRVGYVSSHFRETAVNCFSEPILAAHDHQAVELFCYDSALPAHFDATTQRLRSCADHWREIVAMSDRQVAELIRADRIDILVDLAGHISGNRLLAFAHKPAPIQVTYIGYQNTTGMLAMDYRLTDDWSDPPGTTERFYTERLVRLPKTFFCFLLPLDAPAVTALPALANGFVTFGSFNNPAKITSQVLATWAEILAAAPRSRLLMLEPQTAAFRQAVHAALARQGVEPDRVEFFGRCGRHEYLANINRIDVALDPFPFNGHTTTCDCLYQGVPVVTLAGNTYASRFGGSALATLGLRELIADSRAGYGEIAGSLVGDLDRLAALRARLRPLLVASPIADAAAFTRNLEAAYRTMWIDWCAGQGR